MLWRALSLSQDLVSNVSVVYEVLARRDANSGQS